MTRFFCRIIFISFLFCLAENTHAVSKALLDAPKSSDCIISLLKTVSPAGLFNAHVVDFRERGVKPPAEFLNQFRTAAQRTGYFKNVDWSNTDLYLMSFLHEDDVPVQEPYSKWSPRPSRVQRKLLTATVHQDLPELLKFWRKLWIEEAGKNEFEGLSDEQFRTLRLLAIQDLLNDMVVQISVPKSDVPPDFFHLKVRNFRAMDFTLAEINYRLVVKKLELKKSVYDAEPKVSVDILDWVKPAQRSEDIKENQQRDTIFTEIAITETENKELTRDEILFALKSRSVGEPFVRHTFPLLPLLELGETRMQGKRELNEEAEVLIGERSRLTQGDVGRALSGDFSERRQEKIISLKGPFPTQVTVYTLAEFKKRLKKGEFSSVDPDILDSLIKK